jgi:hypothetical protein
MTMTATVRDSLKRRLSPKTFKAILIYYWYARYYAPRLAASIIKRRAPEVHGRPSDLVDQLHGVNLIAPTAFCRIMTNCRSDKGHPHNYTVVYWELFKKLRDRPLRIFEIGMGTNNPLLASTMGRDGVPGASLRGWCKAFPNAQVFGADIDRDILFAEDRIQTFYCDQLDSNAIRELWAQPAMVGEMDIIIDDGLHTFQANTSFLAGSLEHLRRGGVYVVEDIPKEDLGMWQERLPSYASKFPNCDFALVTLPDSYKDRFSNMLIIRKRS